MQNKNKWEEGFKLLVAYKKEFSDCLVQAKSLYCDYKLGSWVGIQRYKKENLTSERIIRLDALGFVWNSDQAKWEEGFRLLVAYKKEFGNCAVPAQFQYHDYRLGSWVEKRRRIKDKLPTEQIYHLDRVGFVWDIQEYCWEEGLKHLLSYKEEFGDCFVINNTIYHDYNLGLWVSRQRIKQNKLTPLQVKRLDALGFIWNLSKYRWGEDFGNLAAYKEKFGDCLVEERNRTDLYRRGNEERKGYRRLEKWVHYLRSVVTDLRTEQVNSLNKLGFEWDPQEGFQWKYFFKKLVAYKEEFGDCLVEPSQTRQTRQARRKREYSLANWVSQKRSQKDGLTPEQVNSLDELGFVWDAEEAWWQKGFKELVAYKEEFGDCLVEKIPQGPFNSLASWVSRIRNTRDRLTPEQITYLDELEFVWDLQEVYWERYFKLLVAYKEEFGNCLVSRTRLNDPHNLARWVSMTRSQKDRLTPRLARLGFVRLTPEQVTRLDEIGFVWQVK
jgi:hypothetical protein